MNMASLTFHKFVEEVNVVKDAALEAPGKLSIRSINMLQTVSDVQ